MVHQAELRLAIRGSLTRDNWTPLSQIYRHVEREVNLDNEDWQPQSPSSDIPKWQRNDRNSLQSQKRKGEIVWDGQANYRLP